MIPAHADPVAMIEQGAPRIIRSDVQLERYTKALFGLTAKDSPTEVEIEAIDLLSLLVERYEGERHPIPASSPLDVLRFLAEGRGMTQRDLAEVMGVSEPTVSAIMGGSRNLTVPHMMALAAYFSVPGSVFLG